MQQGNFERKEETKEENEVIIEDIIDGAEMTY